MSACFPVCLSSISVFFNLPFKLFYLRYIFINTGLSFTNSVHALSIPVSRIFHFIYLCPNTVVHNHCEPAQFKAKSSSFGTLAVFISFSFPFLELFLARNFILLALANHWPSFYRSNHTHLCRRGVASSLNSTLLKFYSECSATRFTTWVNLKTDMIFVSQW